MRRRLPLVILLAALSLAAPSGATAQTAAPDGAAAAVHREDGSVFAAISQAQFERFFNYAYAQAEQQPRSKAIPLDAPTFERCAASKRWFEGGTRPKRAAGRVRACERRYRRHANTALQQLLNLNWIGLEADRRKMAFTVRRVDRAVREIADTQFDGEAGLRRFQRRSGLNAEDIRLNVVAELGQEAIIRQVKAPLEGRLIDNPSSEKDHLANLKVLEEEQRAINDFRDDFLKRSLMQTRCTQAFATLPACTGEGVDE